MLDKLKARFSRQHQPDPVISVVNRIIENHSATMLEEAFRLVQAQWQQGLPDNGEGAPSASTPASEGPTYTDFVRQRRASLARKLALDLAAQESYEDARRRWAQPIPSPSPAPSPAPATAPLLRAGRKPAQGLTGADEALLARILSQPPEEGPDPDPASPPEVA